MAKHSRSSHQSAKYDNLTVAVLLGLVLLRIINSLSIQTFFQPDEYFQSLEPAWRLAFGHDSGAWITWEWREHLRSSLHPMLFATAYRTSAQLSDLVAASPAVKAGVLIATPKLLQGVIAALGDFFTWRLACKFYGQQHPASSAALALTIFSPWQWFCSVRTLSNSLETTLTIAALYYWPWDWFLENGLRLKQRGSALTAPSEADLDAKKMVQGFKDFLEHGEPSVTNIKAAGSGAALRPSNDATPSGLQLSLTLAALGCTLRPTNLVIWATLSLALFYRYGTLQKMVVLAQQAFLCGTCVLAISLGMDWAYYGEWTFPPLRFLQFNLIQSLSVFYGRNRLDYYLTEGLPLLLTTALPFAAVGVWQALRPGTDRPAFQGYVERQSRLVLAVTVLVTVLAMTMISHKEVRFIYPLLPILHILAAKPLASFFEPFPLPTQKTVRLGLMCLMVTLNVYIAAYAGFVHQRGVIDVMHYLRHEQETRLPSNITVGFLMPCHSTPWRSHFVHAETHAWALTCEPPIGLSISEREQYSDEADVFFAHPAAWIEDNMEPMEGIVSGQDVDQSVRADVDGKRDWPEYLVFFEHLEPVMSRMLERTRYHECWKGFNTHWHDDWRRQGDVLVYCLGS